MSPLSRPDDPGVGTIAALDLASAEGESAEEAVAALAKALSDPHDGVRWAAAQSLGTLASRAKSALPTLENIRRQVDRQGDCAGWNRGNVARIEDAIKRIRGEDDEKK
jgi:hypothetical protein